MSSEVCDGFFMRFSLVYLYFFLAIVSSPCRPYYMLHTAIMAIFFSLTAGGHESCYFRHRVRECVMAAVDGQQKKRADVSPYLSFSHIHHLHLHQHQSLAAAARLDGERAGVRKGGLTPRNPSAPRYVLDLVE